MKQYLNLLRIIREFGVYKQDRTGTGTYSIFAHQMRFDLSDGFPLVTTKKTHLKSIIHELLWFLQGDTNIRYLKENGVKIWDEWVLDGTAEYVDLSLEERWAIYTKDIDAWQAHIYKEAANNELLGLYPQVMRHLRIGTDEEQHAVLDSYRIGAWKNAAGEDKGEPVPRQRLIAGELGPVYGSQWRSWPNPQMVKLGENLSIYERCVEANQHDDYFELLGKAYVKPRGPERNEALKNLSETFDRLGVPKERKVAKVVNPAIDQITNLITQLKNNPDSRRLIVSAWNPAEVDQMALPPCHCLFQFYTAPLSIKERLALMDEREKDLFTDHILEVRGSGRSLIPLTDEITTKHHAFLDSLGIKGRKLSCQLYQRSCDVFLGVPFNIASYALLTMMIAQATNMVPGEFIWTGGDIHIYSNHVEQVDLQLTRTPHKLPTMKINPGVKNLFDFKFEDFELVDYVHDAAISAPIAV